MTKVSRKGSFTQDMFSFECAALRIICGDNSKEVTPVPIPNTEVKLLSADDTWWETAWESKTLPFFLKSDLRMQVAFLTQYRKTDSVGKAVGANGSERCRFG